MSNKLIFIVIVIVVIHQAEPEGLPTEVKGDSLLLLGTLLCGLRISCMGPTPEV